MTCESKPTYTLWTKETRSEPRRAKAYNPTEVRLYGILGPFALPLTLSSNEFEFVSSGYTINLSIKPTDSDLAPLENQPQPSIVAVRTSVEQQIVAIASFPDIDAPNRMEVGVIFAYAYEGHCYDLPKPKIMLIPAASEEIPDGDCGFDNKTDEYRVWIVDKLQQCIEVEVNQGFVEQLVLEANMPGRRSPSTYRATMAVAHRNGRLSE